MPLTTIDAAKGLEQTFKPLLICAITFADASVLRLSTRPLNGTEGGFSYGGNSYLGRILSKDLGALQGFAQGGVDIVPSVSLTLADADKLIYSNYHLPKGFKGAALELSFIFWDADTADFSSDSIKKFVGVCDAAQADETTITVTATNSLNLQRKTIPTATIQRRCVKINPVTAAQKALAANPDSIFFPCGETEAGAVACQYTKATCTRPLRFAGIEFDTPPGGKSRDYINGWIDIQNNPLKGRFGKVIPLVYGTAWVPGIVTSIYGDGNSTRGEAVLCWGSIESILTVLCNDIQLPAANDITGATNYRVEDALLRYNVINRGDRDGGPNADAPWNGAGDPYGSMAAILWVVPRRAQESSGEPQIRALVKGKNDVRIYSGPGSFTTGWTDNPIWIMLDLYVQAGVGYDRFDIATLVTAAAVCDQTINYTDQYGAASTHKRYSCSLVLDKRQSAADAIRRIRRSCGAIVLQSGSTGLLQVFLQGTLASQQSTTVDGSNFNTPVSSVSLTGAAANGYYAYSFDSVRAVNGRSTIKEITPPNNAQPNRVSLSFVNSERDYVQDALAMVDSSAIGLTGSEVAEQLDVDGINTYDQAKRIARRAIGEANYGNPRNDAGGTQVWQFEHSFASVRVRAGHICRLSDAHHGLSNVPVRVLQVRPSSDYEYAQFTVAYHRDAWYTDAYGQDGDPRGRENERDRLARPAFPWRAGMEAPIAGDPMFDATDKTFKLRESHETAADGTSIARVVAQGKWPVNLFSDVNPPIVARQGSTSNSGGTIPGGGVAYYLAVCAVDADGVLSVPSVVCEVAIIAGGSTHTMTVPVSSWAAGTAGYQLFAGTSPNSMTRQKVDTGTPSSITITSYRVNDIGCPDPEFDKLRTKIKRVSHSGVWGAAVSSVGTGAITIAGSGWTASEWVGRDVSLIGKAPGGQLPVASFRVTANTSDTLTVTPNPAPHIAAGDALVMRSIPTVGADYLEDAKWINSFAPSGLNVDAEQGKILRIISGTGAGDIYRVVSNTATRIYIDAPWIRTPDATSRYIVEDSDWVVTQTSDTLNNRDPEAEILQAVEISNYERSTVLVAAYSVDGGGAESFDGITQTREMYVFGAEGTVGDSNIKGGY